MVIIVYLAMVAYALYCGYISSMDLDDENERIAMMVFIALLGSITTLIFATFPHIFSAFFLWLFVTFITSEIIKFVRYHRY